MKNKPFLHRLRVRPAFLFPLLITLALSGWDSNDLMAQASLVPACLALSPVHSTSTIAGFVTNHCGKSVTAYAIDAVVLYSDGSKSIRRGAREEYMPALAHSRDLPTVNGRGTIRPEETRPLHSFGLPPSQKDGVMTAGAVPTISAVVFEDGSAVGDETIIQEIFNDRLLAAKEAAFWRATLNGMKGKLMTAAKLRDCLDSPEIKARIAGADKSRQGFVIRSHYDNILRMAQSFDSQPSRFSRSEALTLLLTFADDSDSSDSLHSRRREGIR